MNLEITIALVLTFVLALIAFRSGYGARLFEFPFLFCGVWVGFVMIGFLEFAASGDLLFEIYRQIGTVAACLFMMVLSAASGLFGYYVVRKRRRLRRRKRQYHYSARHLTHANSMQPPRRRVLKNNSQPTIHLAYIKYMHTASFVLAAMSYLAFYQLTNLGGGIRAFLLESGNYYIVYEGLPVYLVLVVRFIYVSIVIQLWIWSRTRKKKHFFYALAFSLIPFANIFFLFRRSEFMTIGIFYGYFIVNYTRIRIGRIPAFLSIAMMYLVLKIFPLLRSEEGKQTALLDLLDTATSGERNYETSEIASGLYRIYFTSNDLNFQYGAIFWNAFVKQFLPRTLVGSDFKDSLYINQIELSDAYFTAYKFYLSPMGFAQAYQQFWYFGCLIFAIIGAIIAVLENNKHKNPRIEIFLVLMLPALLSVVSADLSLIVSRSIIYGFLVLVCVPYLSFGARRRRRPYQVMYSFRPRPELPADPPTAPSASE